MPDFEEIYQTYFADVYRYILALSRDAHTAEEVTQETFFRALASIDQFRGDCQLRVWLCQIARNQYLSLCRERKHRGELEQEPGDDGLECGFADRDAAKRLHRLLHDLPEPYKEVFSLRTFGELPFAQIGELFGKTESWARVTYFRARQKWTSWTMISYRTCCPCTTMASARTRAGRRWKNTCKPVRTAERHWKRWTRSCPRKKLPLTTRRR